MRHASAQRHDAALVRWPTRQGQPFTRELTQVVNTLEALAREADATGGDMLERSRTWRYLGDVYFDLARGKEASLLAKGSEAYTRAEALLKGLRNTLEEAKLNFNYANTLRGLSGGTRRALMEEAKARYQRAAALFERELPQYLSQVTSALGSLEGQLSLLGLHEEATAKVDQLKEIEEVLTRGGAGISPDSEQEAKRRLKAFKAEEKGISAVRRDMLKILDSLKGLAAGGSTSFDPAVLDQMQREFTSALDATAPGGEAVLVRRLFRSLKDRFRAEIASGKVSRERQQALEPLRDELEDLLDHSPTEVSDLMTTTARMRELIARITPLLARPSYGKEPPPPDSRAAYLMEQVAALKAFAASEVNRPNLGPLEKRAGTDLLTRLTRAGGDTLDAKENEAQLTTIEREVLRPLAHDLRAFGQRRHILLATPLWASPAVTVDPNLLFFSGGAAVAKRMEAMCRERKLTLAARSTGRNVGQSRRDDLRKAVIAVFDLTVEPGPPLAAVCFEVGMAQALGKPTVILADRGRPVPFDIESEPFELTGSDEDPGTIREALDAALYGIPRREDHSSGAASIAFARRQFGTGDTRFEVRHALKLLDEAEGDPIEIRRMLETLTGYLGTKAPQLLLPAWPGAYPEPGAKRCFHVMAFRPKWANTVMKVAHEACARAGAQYVRGDQVADPRIIRSIWDEICRATHVLVDLTGFNANVALELGMALTLGKNTLIMGQGDTVERLFPSIAKLRVHGYQLGDGMQSLRDLMSRHVQR